MSTSDFLSKLRYYDVYLSSIVHGHESLMLTVLLFVPGILFSPKVIAAPIFLITLSFGYRVAIEYVIAVLIGVLLSGHFKRQTKRHRPKPRPELSLKPMYFRNLETNYSFPSGDSTQAGIFAIYFLSNYVGPEQTMASLIVVLIAMNVVLARVYFCCHYFTDCYAGLILGVFVSLVVRGFALTLIS